MNPLRKPFKYCCFYSTFALLIINFALFFLQKFMFPKMNIVLGMSIWGLKNHYFWQPLTYMFCHSGWNHIIFNMLALFCFGIAVEKAIGSWEFLLFYLVCGILDGLISILLYWILGINTLLVGASGAIYALLLLYAVLFPQNKIYIWGIIPIKSPLLVGIYAIIELGSELFGSNDGIAHLAHLSGFVVAWLYIVIRMGINPIKVWKRAFSRNR